ncbi:MAG: polyphosphate polymerase domain-containing protein [Myxococcales bacterium]|nr:polyphosphate polymerase domain-containing protein [Myxococcales bacterium]
MQLDFQRYECKYIIPEHLHDQIVDFVSCYSHPDEYTESSPDRRYVITSLYLDSPQLTCHHAKEHKALNRFKLRIRTYGERSDGPIFFEIKRKIKGVIFKRRVQTNLSSWTSFEPDSSELLTKPNHRNVDVMSEFMALCEQYNMGPSMVVRYTREAYESDIDSYGRVTFDRKLLSHFPEGYQLDVDPSTWFALDDPVSMGISTGTVLELKFANRAPMWMKDLVQRFGLQMRGFSKYSTAVNLGLNFYYPDVDLRVPRWV